MSFVLRFVNHCPYSAGNIIKSGSRDDYGGVVMSNKRMIAGKVESVAGGKIVHIKILDAAPQLTPRAREGRYTI